MLGYLFLRAHVAFQAVTAPIRKRRQSTVVRCLQAVSDAKDEVRRAKVRGDTRRQHQAMARLQSAMTELLRAERRLGWKS
ncbi:hypothetical protein [Brevundimonas sp.]|uniref:hypothetical protein n=1 Tax=Brevundimonas sp. TaxID=1871086 RepID=UPI0028AA26B6|nr:hypothetical protein [Brevundimonas sp.]